MRFDRSIHVPVCRRAVALLIWAAICESFCPGRCYAQPLKWKFAVDDQFTVQFVQQSDTLTNVVNRTPGAVPRATTTKVATTLEMDWKVIEIDDKQNAVIEQSITLIRLTVNNPALPASSVELDTSQNEKVSAASRTLLDQITPLIGLKFTVTLSPQGAIVSVAMPEATQTTLRQLPGALQLQALFSEQGVAELIGAAAIVFPDQQLKPDESWESRSQVATPFGELSRVRKYVYAGDEKQAGRNVAVFEIKTSLDEISQEKVPGTDPPSLLSFSESGEGIFDIEAGHFRSCRVQGTTKTARDYREKRIETTVENSLQMTINKQ